VGEFGGLGEFGCVGKLRSVGKLGCMGQLRCLGFEYQREWREVSRDIIAIATP
jgi:hypothetical protein